MRNGLYSVRFQVPGDQGAGVIFVQDGKMWGGDDAFYYLGTYTDSGDKITATVKTNRHTPKPGFSNIFGTDRVNITLQGTSTGDVATFSGAAAEAPGVRFAATLTRVSD